MFINRRNRFKYNNICICNHATNFTFISIGKFFISRRRSKFTILYFNFNLENKSNPTLKSIQMKKIIALFSLIVSSISCQAQTEFKEESLTATFFTSENTKIDFKSIFAKSDQSGMKHFYIEQEQYPSSSVESIKNSILNLRKALK